MQFGSFKPAHNKDTHYIAESINISSLKVYSPILPYINIKTEAKAQFPFTVPWHCAFPKTVLLDLMLNKITNLNRTAFVLPV